MHPEVDSADHLNDLGHEFFPRTPRKGRPVQHRNLGVLRPRAERTDESHGAQASGLRSYEAIGLCHFKLLSLQCLVSAA